MASSTSNTLFELCAADLDDELQLLDCISKHYHQVATKQLESYADTENWFLMLAGALVFFMQAGFAMVCAGAVRKKNVQNTMMKNILDACGASVAFYAFGYALAFGDKTDDPNQGTTFAGTANFFTTGRKEDVHIAFWFFQFCFSATCVTIVAGSLAERCKMSAYFLYSLYLSGFVYPIVAHAVWSPRGFFSTGSANPLLGFGVIDFAGSGVVHMTGGTVALVASAILGARIGRFHDASGRRLPTPRVFPAYSVALQLLGTFILWFGWYGFNGGSALLLGVPNSGAIGARAVANTSIGAGAGGMGALASLWVYGYIVNGEPRFDLPSFMNGVLSGLVSVTGACGTIDLWAAFVIGSIGGALFHLGKYALEVLCIDDAVDAVPVHLLSGIWGMIAVGLFSTPSAVDAAFGSPDFPGLFYGDWRLFVNQLFATVAIILWASLTTAPLFFLLSRTGMLRTLRVEEVVGLDMKYHGNVPENISEVQDDLRSFKTELDRVDISGNP